MFCADFKAWDVTVYGFKIDNLSQLHNNLIYYYSDISKTLLTEIIFIDKNVLLFIDTYTTLLSQIVQHTFFINIYKMPRSSVSSIFDIIINK